MPVSDARLPACDAAGDCEECIARAARDRQGGARRREFPGRPRQNARSSAFSWRCPGGAGASGGNVSRTPATPAAAGGAPAPGVVPRRRRPAVPRRRSAGGPPAGRREIAGQSAVRYATCAERWACSPGLPAMITPWDGRGTPRHPAARSRPTRSGDAPHGIASGTRAGFRPGGTAHPITGRSRLHISDGENPEISPRRHARGETSMGTRPVSVRSWCMWGKFSGDAKPGW